MIKHVVLQLHLSRKIKRLRRQLEHLVGAIKKSSPKPSVREIDSHKSSRSRRAEQVLQLFRIAGQQFCVGNVVDVCNGNVAWERRKVVPAVQSAGRRIVLRDHRDGWKMAEGAIAHVWRLFPSHLLYTCARNWNVRLLRSTPDRKTDEEGHLADSEWYSRVSVVCVDPSPHVVPIPRKAVSPEILSPWLDPGRLRIHRCLPALFRIYM